MGKKKILFITNELYPDLNANSEIVYRLATEIQKQNCDVSVMGYHNMRNCRIVPDPFGFHTVAMKGIDDFSKIMQNGKSKYLRLLQLMIHPKSLRFFFRQRKFNGIEYRTMEYAEEIALELKKNKYDCIVNVSNPIESIPGLINSRTQLPIILYKLDPWSIPYIVDENQFLQKFYVSEEQADERADAIITTPIIVRDYYSKRSSRFRYKVTAAEFPNILEYQKISERIFDTNSIHCVFAGRFYEEIRNPKYVISLFENLKEHKIVFHIVGETSGNGTIPKILPSNIVCHGHVSSNEAMRYMQSSDILVNIGNTVLDMMPSKTLTYISLGKPILNIIKSTKCPTLPYVEKYPLALNVLETTEVQQEDVARVRDFIFSSKGKQIPFAEIKEKYYTCTPEYVGKQLYDVICNVVKEKNIKE